MLQNFSNPNSDLAIINCDVILCLSSINVLKISLDFCMFCLPAQRCHPYVDVWFQHFRFCSSSLINHVLINAHKRRRSFRVVVVDGRPKLSGRNAVRRLCAAGIQCSYVLVSAVSYIMPEVTFLD